VGDKIIIKARCSSGTPTDYNLIVVNAFLSPLSVTLPSDGSWKIFTFVCTAISTSIGFYISAFTESSTYTLDLSWFYQGNGSFSSTTNIGGTAQVPGMTVNDFTTPLEYNVVSEDSTYQIYTVHTEYLYITYDGNGNDGGTAPSDSNVYEYSEMVTVLSAGTLTKTGFTFSKWNTAADGSGTNYNVGSKPYIVANMKLYAQWI
jgi:uncharacterized repeat protein (TIGR02543 family)